MANPQVEAIVKQAQLFANDEDGTKVKPESYLAYLNTAIQLLYVRHPSAFYIDTIVTQEPTVADISGEIVVSPLYAEAFAHYMASKALVEGAAGDDEFNAKLAKTHLDLFNAA